jgi:uncharacterized membrane protein YadS
MLQQILIFGIQRRLLILAPFNFKDPIMTHPHPAHPNPVVRTIQQPAWWLGILLAGAIAAGAIAASQLPSVVHLGLSSLTLSIVFGIIAGNTFFRMIATHTATGVDFSKSMLLRAGIILFGFRITFQQIAGVGWEGILIDLLIVTMTLLLAVQLGKRVFKMDYQSAILIGAGSAICGAAAVMATEPVVRGQAHKVSVAVATVVVFGTLAMFTYPLVYPYLHLSEQYYGIFVGSTIHEVAQVVAAGKSVSDAAVNSLHLLPAALVNGLLQIDNVLLTTAMAALGLRTHVGAIRQAGAKPLMLATLLFAFLTIGGYAINRFVIYMLG